jgi:carboxymethylenebutenolidase
VGAVGSFHGAAMVTPAPDSPHRLLPQTKAQYLIAVAENDDQKDPQAKVALRTALEAARLPGEVEVYPAAHGWCPPDTQVYDAAQSERAWARLLATFKQALA